MDLSEKWVEEAIKAWKLLKEQNIQFKKAFTSYLKRAIKTLNVVLDQMNLDWIPVEKTWRLNEKHYGMLQWLNKKETSIRNGKDLVYKWRRSYSIPPPKLDENDERNPANIEQYKHVQYVETISFILGFSLYSPMHLTTKKAQATAFCTK